MNNTQMVACPNCGKEQQRLSTIQGEEYIAVCGPTCGCGHKWTVYPEPQTAPAYTAGVTKWAERLAAELLIERSPRGELINDLVELQREHCDTDDPDAVCHRCGLLMNAVHALRGSHDAKGR